MGMYNYATWHITGKNHYVRVYPNVDTYTNALKWKIETVDVSKEFVSKLQNRGENSCVDIS